MDSFKPGDKVRSTTSGAVYTFSFGPYIDKYSNRSCLVGTDDGRNIEVLAGALMGAHTPHANPRVEAAARWLYDDDCTFERWDELTPSGRAPYYQSATELLEAIDAATPERDLYQGGTDTDGRPLYSDPAPRYKDWEGNVWEGQPHGNFLWVQRANGYGSPCHRAMSYESLDNVHGPLTRIN